MIISRIELLIGLMHSIMLTAVFKMYRVAQETGPSYLIANILKTPRPIAWKLVNFCNIIC